VSSSSLTPEQARRRRRERAAATRDERKAYERTLNVFGNAVREVLRLEPIYHVSGSSRRAVEERFFIYPVVIPSKGC